MITLSFPNNLPMSKSVAKLLAESCNLKSLKPVYELVSIVDKEFADHYKEDNII
jgi:hypothetical protein